MKKIKKDLISELELKELACKYYPKFYLDLEHKYTVLDLEKAYIEYLNQSIYSEEKDSINKSYDYLYNHMTANNYKEYKLESPMVKEIHELYQEFIRELNSYKFNTKLDNSVGYFQNLTNQNIVFEISLLHPVLEITLKNIDNYITRNSKIIENYFNNNFKYDSLPEEVIFYYALVRKLRRLSNILYEDCIFDLAITRRHYHVTWNKVIGKMYLPYEYCSVQDLAKAKRNWQRKRNKACHEILAFFKELEDINIAIYYKTFNYRDKFYGLDEQTLEVSNIYNFAIDNISNGPNYLCYLNTHEKQKLAEEKLLKKLKD